jgi:hypothetical protein
MVARVGFFATASRESRQARKGATVTVMSSAEEAPARAATILYPQLCSLHYLPAISTDLALPSVVAMHASPALGDGRFVEEGEACLAPTKVESQRSSRLPRCYATPTPAIAAARVKFVARTFSIAVANSIHELSRSRP